MFLQLMLTPVFDFVVVILFAVRGRSPKRLLEYLFFMWDPELADSDNQLLAVLEDGFRDSAAYEVCVRLLLKIAVVDLYVLLVIFSPDESRAFF